jgi:hypothetical protein
MVHITPMAKTALSVATYFTLSNTPCFDTQGGEKLSKYYLIDKKSVSSLGLWLVRSGIL